MHQMFEVRASCMIPLLQNVRFLQASLQDLALTQLSLVSGKDQYRVTKVQRASVHLPNY